MLNRKYPKNTQPPLRSKHFYKNHKEENIQKIKNYNKGTINKLLETVAFVMIYKL